MIPERRLLHEELHALNRIGVDETCVIIVVKVGWIGQTIVTNIAPFSRVNAHRVGHFFQPSE